MSTTNCGTELDLVHERRGTESRLAIVLTRLKSVWRAVSNRVAANSLSEMDDHQLDDIGLTRHELMSALSDTSALEDPTLLLARSARERARGRFQRPRRR